MIQDDDNLSFGNNIDNKDRSSTRIIFSNTNGLNLDINAHSLCEILVSNNMHNESILIFVETNTHWKKKHARDKFR